MNKTLFKIFLYFFTVLSLELFFAFTIPRNITVQACESMCNDDCGCRTLGQPCGAGSPSCHLVGDCNGGTCGPLVHCGCSGCTGGDCSGGGGGGGDPCWPYGCPPPPPPPPTATPVPTSTPTPTPTPARVSVNGTVYDDPTGLSGGLGKCTGPVGAPIKPGGGTKVKVNPDDREGPVQGNGSYTVNQVLEAGAKDILMQAYDPQYQCTCPTGCQYSGVSIASGNNSGWDFFVSQVRPKWLKVLGGSVHSQGNLNSDVPSGNVYIADFTGDGPGALTKSAGSGVNFGSGTLSSQPSWNFNDLMSTSNWKYGYQAMWLRAGNPATDPGDGSSPPAAGVYRKSGNYSISGSWTNLAGSRVVFVRGDVTINANITLGNSAFLAIVASGNITVNPAVGNIPPKAVPTSADAALSGAFFADGSFIGGTTGAQNDKQLVIYGSVAADADLNGVGAVSSQRDLGGLNATPGVAFIWNPNLILNAPQQFTDAVTDWREVAP